MMTIYKLVFYKKNARSPYKTEYGELPNGFHPRLVDSKECFNYRLKGAPGRVEIRYKSNDGLAGKTVKDGTKIQWFKC